ncbi:MAG: S-methyl-5-thioribose-1-phosphate isomerase [Planctomycetota bacterium]
MPDRTPAHPPTLCWSGGPGDGVVEMIDQTKLPESLEVLRVDSVKAMIQAMRRLSVRGAPALGIAAAYGAILGLRELPDNEAAFRERFSLVVSRIRAARPTAVNLGWALDRLSRKLDELSGPPRGLRQQLLAEARAIHEEDAELCLKLGQHGAALIRDGDRLLTHCNTGALATGGRGTALAAMFKAHEAGLKFEVWVDETRPLLQGTRLTSWELMRAGIRHTLICDNAAASLMAAGRVDRIFVGADRIAANGDTANKIGTYALALGAKAHDLPFYVVAPSSTIDFGLADGSAIPIEERDPAEITAGFARAIAPPGVRAYAPAFDVTPAGLISGIVTEFGVLAPHDLRLSIPQ